MTEEKKMGILPYLGAVAIVVAATLFRLAVDPFLDDRQPFSAFLVAVVVTARYCGFRPALLTLVLSGFAARYFFMLPRGEFGIAGTIQQVAFGFFLLFSLLFSFLIRAEQLARRKLEREIEERKRVEAELRISQDRFHSFIDNGPFAAFVKDADGKYVYVNKYVERSSQIATARWLGKSDAELFPSAELARCLQDDRRVMDDNASIQIDETTAWPGGGVQHWTTMKFPLPGADGRRLLGGLAIDITEVRKAEHESRDSEARLLLALEAGRQGTFSWDMATDRIRASDTFAVLHGWPPGRSEVSVEESLARVHPDDKHLLEALMEDAIEGRVPERIAYRVVWADGGVHWVEGIGRLFRDASGKPSQVVGVISDVTERKRAESDLRDSEERFRLLATHAPIGIIQSDSEGRTFFVNSKWCEIAGAAPEECMAYGWKEFLHPDDRAGLVESWNAAMADGRTYFSAEFRFLRKDGSIRQARSTATLIHDADGVPTGQIGITEDVTERKAAEDTIRARESQLRGILDNAPAVIYLKDSEGRYLLTNRRFREVIERAGESIVGLTDSDYFPEPIARTFQDSDAAIWRTQGPLNFEEDAPHADGLHTYRSVKFPVRDEAGHMIAMGGISTDITDLKAAHEALTAERELLRNLIEVQEKEKQFLCHEFHDGLMQYAVGSLMSLSSYQEKHPSSEAAAAIDWVIGNLSKGIEDGRRAMRGIRPSVLDDFELDAAIDDLIEQFSNSDIMVTSKCDPQIGRLPNAIQTTVYRVVQEALNNARKHSGTDVIRIELKKVDDQLHLEVRDFGCGFDVASARNKGFGLLGMTERVRLLGGECLIQSELDEGTRVSVRLPIPGIGRTITDG